MNCNYKLRDLAVHVKEGIRAAGGTPMEFNTIAISDGITMGTEGMKASLVSREVIADSIELMERGHMFDGIVALVACDKTIPGAGMALLRLNVPGVILYGGSILPGRWRGKDITILDVFEAMGANAAGKISDDELLEIENHACPGAGACGGQFTANTMATVMELIGLSPMGTASLTQVDIRKEDDGAALRRGDYELRAEEHSSARHCDENGVLECDCGRGRDGRLDQRCAASARHGARSRYRAEHQRLSDHQRTHADSSRSQAGRAVQRSGRRQSGRHSGDRAAARGGEVCRPFRHHMHRADVRRRSREGRGDRRTESHSRSRQADQTDRRSRDSARLPRPRWLRDQTFGT